MKCKLILKYSNGTDKPVDVQYDEPIIKCDPIHGIASIDMKNSVPSYEEEVLGEAPESFGEATINESDNSFDATLDDAQQYDKVPS